jgi:Glycosyl transferase family 11
MRRKGARPTVIVRIADGLGNQLFGYAAARRMALANNAELVIDDVTGFSRDFRFHRKYALDHFNIRARKAAPSERYGRFERPRRFLSKVLARLWPLRSRRYLDQGHSDFDERILGLRVDGSVYLDGYWQSESYFKDVEETLRQDLAIAVPRDAFNRDMAARMRDCRSVALHVRCFDAPGGLTGANLPEDYYLRAIDLMERSVPLPHFFLFSDDPESARARLPTLDGRVTSVTHNQDEDMAYADLWLMTQCEHNIIANSTFSWWGAWLGAGADSRIVIAPCSKRYAGLAGWGIKGLIPERWKEV